MQRRRDYTLSEALRARLSREAKACRDEAERLPQGPRREALLQQAKQTETAAHIDEWAKSPGLVRPR